MINIRLLWLLDCQVREQFFVRSGEPPDRIPVIFPAGNGISIKLRHYQLFANYLSYHRLLHQFGHIF